MIDALGRATHSKLYRREYEDGTIAPGGFSKQLHHELMRKWIRIIDAISCYYTFSDESSLNPLNLWRSGKDALKLYLHSWCLNRMCQGYGYYHKSNVNVNRMQNNRNCTMVASKYEFAEGSSQYYYIFDKTLILTLTGDGSSHIKHTPVSVKSMTFFF